MTKYDLDSELNEKSRQALSKILDSKKQRTQEVEPKEKSDNKEDAPKK